MDRSMIMKTGLMPSVVMSLFLATATVSSTNAHANTPNVQSPAGVQLAWWAGGNGYHGGFGYRGYGGYNRGFYNGGYYNSGFRPYYRGACQRNCWQNQWGQMRCATRCY